MTTTTPPRWRASLIDRRRFLGLCAMAAVVAACGDSDDDDTAANTGADTAASAGTIATTDAGGGPALRVASVEALSVGQLIHVAFRYPLQGARRLRRRDRVGRRLAGAGRPARHHVRR